MTEIRVIHEIEDRYGNEKLAVKQFDEFRLREISHEYGEIMVKYESITGDTWLENVESITRV